MVRANDSTALFCASALALALSLASSASAHDEMGGGGGMNGHFGGNSASHISAQGLAHTNGPNAADRDFGRDRAEDVRNAHAQTHSRSQLHAHGMHATSHRTVRHAPRS